MTAPESTKPGARSANIGGKKKAFHEKSLTLCLFEVNQQIALLLEDRDRIDVAMNTRNSSTPDHKRQNPLVGKEMKVRHSFFSKFLISRLVFLHYLGLILTFKSHSGKGGMIVAPL